MAREIMPGAPPHYQPTPAESVLLGFGAVLLGLVIGPPSQYGLGLLGVVLVALGARDWWRARRERQ